MAFRNNNLKPHRTTEELEALAKRYDFSSTNRFSKELLTFFENWATNYSRLLSNTLSLRLSTTMKIHLEAMTQLTYGSYMEHYSSDLISVIYNLPPLKGSFLINFDRTFASLSIDSILGGSFEGTGTLIEITDVEKALIETVTTYFLDAQEKAWSEYERVTQKVRSVELNPSMMQLVPDNETILVLDFVIEAIHHRFPFKLIIPHQSIENVVEKIVSRHDRNQLVMDVPNEVLENLDEEIDQMKVRVAVELGSASLSLDVLEQIKVGNMVKLDRKLNGLLDVRVVDGNGELQTCLFRVQPVAIGKQLAVQIVDVVKRPYAQLDKKEK